MNVPNVFATQPVAEPVIAAIAIADAVPAAEPVQHSNLIGIVTRTSWVSRRKGLVQQALDRLAGKAVLDRDGKRTIEFQVITAEDRLDVSKLDNTHSQMLAGIGEYIRVNVDLAAPGGQEYAHDLIQRRRSSPKTSRAWTASRASARTSTAGPCTSRAGTSRKRSSSRSWFRSPQERL